LICSALNDIRETFVGAGVGAGAGDDDSDGDGAEVSVVFPTPFLACPRLSLLLFSSSFLFFSTVTTFLPISLSPNLYLPPFTTFSPTALSPNLYVSLSPFLPFLLREPFGHPLPSFRFTPPMCDGDGDDDDCAGAGAGGGGGDVPELR
jgi:hypothetical protein